MTISFTSVPINRPWLRKIVTKYQLAKRNIEKELIKIFFVVQLEWLYFEQFIFKIFYWKWNKMHKHWSVMRSLNQILASHIIWNFKHKTNLIQVDTYENELGSFNMMQLYQLMIQNHRFFIFFLFLLQLQLLWKLLAYKLFLLQKCI